VTNVAKTAGFASFSLVTGCSGHPVHGMQLAWSVAAV
jgi:hypothetical protein